MYQPITVCIGLRYIIKQQNNRFDSFIALTSIITIMLGVMALITILSIMNGFEYELKKQLLTFTPHAILTTKEGNMDYQYISKKKLEKLKGINQISTIVTSDIILQSSNNISMGTMIAIDPNNFEPLSKYIINTSINTLIPGKYHIILSTTLAKILKVQAGDQIHLILPHITQITPIGYLPIQRIFKIVGTYNTNTNIDNYQFLINQEDGSRLMHYPPGHITGLRLWLQKPLQIHNFNKQQLPKNIIWKDWRERHENLFQAIQMEKNIMTLLLSSIILVSSFSIIAFSSLLITRKKSEIAILKTQGLTKSKILCLFTIQGISIGIIGTMLGILFGLLLIKKINYITPNIISIYKICKYEITLPTHIELWQIITISILSIFMSFLSTLYPAKLASNINPQETLRHE